MIENTRQTGWYYEINGERRGPVSQSSIIQLYHSGIIQRETLVWKQGYPDWRPLSQPGLISQNAAVPPPVSGSAVDNTIVWWLAFMPILGSIIEYIVAVSIGVGSESLWFITLGLNIWLCSLDEKKLKAAGYNTQKIGSAWLIPAYLFKRAKMLGQSNGYAIVWCITFAILLFA
ncbi:MAG: hypothetical protein ACFWUC_13640 [Oscillospiraceae bacterium]|jgi:hypothetical protein